ncbi:hypothetical protein GCM10027403_19250 [Arthrobacter tecti]
MIIGGGEYSPGEDDFQSPEAVYSLDRWSDKINTNLVKPRSVEEAGLDLATLKFSTTGAVAQSFGTEWIERWNSLVTREGTGRPEVPTAPGRAKLSADNARGGSYTVTADLKNGQNGTSFRLYEDGVLITEIALRDESPNGQRVSVPVSGKAKGKYTYTCVLVNAGGETPCKPHVVKVKEAKPAKPKPRR